MSSTPRQQIVTDRNTIQVSWYTFSDTKQWTKLINSHNVIAPRIEVNCSIIVAQNPGNTTLNVRRGEVVIALDLVRDAADAKNTTLCNTRINQLVQKINSFLNVAPAP